MDILTTLSKLSEGSPKERLSQWLYFIEQIIVLPNIYLVIFIEMHSLALRNCLLSSGHSYVHTNATITNFIKKPQCITKRKSIPRYGISNVYLNSLSTLNSFFDRLNSCMPNLTRWCTSLLCFFGVFFLQLASAE